MKRLKLFSLIGKAAGVALAFAAHFGNTQSGLYIFAGLVRPIFSA